MNKIIHKKDTQEFIKLISKLKKENYEAYIALKNYIYKVRKQSV